MLNNNNMILIIIKYQNVHLLKVSYNDLVTSRNQTKAAPVVLYVWANRKSKLGFLYICTSGVLYLFTGASYGKTELEKAIKRGHF